MSRKETNITNAIRIAISKAGGVTWRNETGKGWVGQRLYQHEQTVTIDNARFIAFGLAVGGSDIIGIAPDGRFLAIEVKTKTGRPSEEQSRFIEIVKKRGGRAGIARSVAEALAIATD